MARNLKDNTSRAKLIICAFLAIMVVVISSAISASATGTIEINPMDPYASKEEEMEDDGGDVIYRGATELGDGDKITNGDSFTSTTESENALLVKNAKLDGTNISVRKTGSSSKKSAFTEGTNAAILLDGSELSLVKPSIDTGGSFSSGLFTINNAKASLLNGNIITTGDYANGIVANYDSSIKIEKTMISTSGDRAAAIRAGAKGGKITVDGGQFKTTGINSPIVYASSEGVVMQRAKMEASNSSAITLVESGKTFFGYNNIIGGAEGDTKAGEPKITGSIYLYQPADGSGAGTVQLDLERNTITTKKGSIISATNTGATISMNHNSIVYPEDEKEPTFMEIGSASTSSSATKSPYGGASVDLKAEDQLIKGNIKVDRYSTLSLSLDKKSRFVGAINTDNTALRVELSLSDDSVMVLTGDTYVDILSVASGKATNIYANGFKLYVAGEQVAINNSEKVPSYDYNFDETGPNANAQVVEETDSSQMMILLLAAVVIVVALVLIALIAFKMHQSKKQKAEQQMMLQNDARARIEAQMRAQEQSPDFGKNQYPNVHV